MSRPQVNTQPTNAYVSEEKPAGNKEGHNVTLDACQSPSLGGSSASWSPLDKSKLLDLWPIKSLASTVLGDRLDQTSSHHARRTDRPWRPTWLRFGPLSGILAMLLAAASLVASLGVLAGADGQSVESWPSPPSTFLAIFTAIANLSMRYAALQGVINRWWTTAAKGTNISDLHWNWRSGTSIHGALMAGRRMGLIGLACIFSTLVVVDGPLLQRASTITPSPRNSRVQLNVTMAQELPRGFSGFWATDVQEQEPGQPVITSFNSTIPTNNGSVPNNIFPNKSPDVDHFVTTPWWNIAPLGGVVEGCPGECTAKIKAPALFPSVCTSHSIPVAARDDYNLTLVYENFMAPPLDAQLFIIAPSILTQDHEAVNLITGFATTDSDCKGTLQYRICTLESAIGEYDIKIRNNRILMDELSTPSLVAIANNTATDHTFVKELGGQPSTLGGVVAEMYIRWMTSSFMYSLPSGGAESVYYGTAGEEEFSIAPKKGQGNKQCRSYVDPYDRMIRSMNQLMVYVGALAAQRDESYLEDRMDPGLPVHVSITGDAAGTQPVFHVNYWFFLAAAVLEAICIALVAPTYWGWWKLGRPVSFSPLEMAKAFESPLLSSSNSNSKGAAIARDAGDASLKYGLRYEDGKRSKLAFGDPGSVAPPQRGMRFDV